MNLGKSLYCLILGFIICKMRKQEWVISRIPAVLKASASSALPTKEIIKYEDYKGNFYLRVT